MRVVLKVRESSSSICFFLVVVFHLLLPGGLPGITVVCSVLFKMVKSSQASGKNNEKNVLWTGKDNFTFFSVIKAFQAENGYSTVFPWIALLDEFKKKTGNEVTIKAGKNKFNYLKKKWSSWNYLRHKVTGAGWDQETGLITADDAWWELQKVEEFYQFRKKAPSLKVRDL